MRENIKTIIFVAGVVIALAALYFGKESSITRLRRDYELTRDSLKEEKLKVENFLEVSSALRDSLDRRDTYWLAVFDSASRADSLEDVRYAKEVEKKRFRKMSSTELAKEAIKEYEKFNGNGTTSDSIPK